MCATFANDGDADDGVMMKESIPETHPIHYGLRGALSDDVSGDGGGEEDVQYFLYV